jgi:Ca-activated chloride channel homolog
VQHSRPAGEATGARKGAALAPGVVWSRLIVVGVGLLCLTSPQAALPQARPRPPTFGTGVEIVNLSLSVTDDRSSFVTDLRQGDFAVFEDGVPQALAFFTQEDLPISLVLMIDGSGSMEEKRTTAQQAAVRLARTLRAEDLAQVVEFNDRARVLQPFTHDRASVEAAIRRTDAAGATALQNAVYIAIKELQRDAPSELRRRAIVLFTDGEDTASLVTDDQVLDLAKKSQVNIYAITLRSQRPSDRMRPSTEQAEYLMNALARETGGRAYFPTALSELDSVYDRIAEELRTLYSVGYVSSNGRRDGQWRRILVRVQSREGLKVRHRLGYYAPTG